MFDLTMCSIFRQSENYLPQYLKQADDVFISHGGKCRAVWLEGDSTDNTYSILCEAKKQFEDKGYDVKLIKYDCHGPYWESKVDEKRWLQLSTCWNKCL